MANVLPFSHIDNNELFLEMEKKTELIDTTPSFSIQSLLDKMPGQNFETDEFMSESESESESDSDSDSDSDRVSSKYFTPFEFLKRKCSPNHFSMIHINLACLSKHVDELRSLICNLNHPFDVIGITETRLYDDDPLVNIEIDGYEFKHTPTCTQCGVAGIYIR